MRRVPLLSGSRIVVCPVGDEDVVIRPPPPPARVVDTGPAVLDALRFPLSGSPLSALAARGGRATIVVEPPALPLPGAPLDPRRDALAAVVAALEQAGIDDEKQTILVAGGLGRRLGQRELERLLPPPQARAFRGNVVVHDAESADLIPLTGDTRAHPALVETDLVVVATAAETALHGGAGALLASCDAETQRRVASIDSLLQAAGAPEWEIAIAVESALADRVPLIGLSLSLDHPRLTGRFRDYPHDDSSLEHVVRSPFRRLYSLLPGGVRRSILSDQGRRLS
ncbi:MAG TPA: lactate racemase domain-containing protein, partial [Gaiellaceae bacterium]|nr:lactate racemase domain-containing protein [Gaiellaceae bacterium]